jgi:aminoglycoside phosphotransferase (APT) family kinase protein
VTDPQLVPWRGGAEELCPDASFVAVLRHVPGRRVTSLIDLGDRHAVLKIFASPRARGNHRRLKALAGSSVGDIVPEALGADRAGRVGLLGYAEGTPLHLLDDLSLVRHAAAVGSALRRLHASRVDMDRSWTVAEELGQLARRATPRSRRLVDRLTGHAPPYNEPLVPSHRDFHLKQVVIAPGGTPRLIDLDDAAMSPAGLDVGNFLAHLDEAQLSGIRMASVVRDAADAFAAGYGPMPSGTERWRLLALVRLAGLAESRHGDDTTAAALEAAALSAVSRSRPIRDRQPSDPTSAVRRLGFSASGPSQPLNRRHRDRPVTLVPTTAGALVVKELDAARAHRVATWMTALWDGPIGVRRSAAGIPEPVGSSGRFVAMSHVPGEQLAVRGELPPRREAEVAALLADLHRSRVPGLPLRDGEAIVRSIGRKLAEMPPARRELFAPTVDVLAALIPMEEELVTTHGDWAPRNILVSDAGLRMIDLDRLQLAHPARDVAYYGAWCYATEFTLGRAPCWDVGDALVTEYARARPDSDVRRTLPFHRAAALIRIAHGWSALTSDDRAIAVIAAEALRQAEEWAATGSVGDPGQTTVVSAG